MLPSLTYAKELLSEAEHKNPGPWADHSRTVADCAKKIAERCSEMDAEKAYIVGLLHDIGRREGVRDIAHVLDGYHFLIKLGYEEPAKICITHSFPVKDVKVYCGKVDISESEYEKLKTLLEDYEYDDYDRLIQLCDSIAFPDGAVDLKIRMDDVEKRHGFYPPEKRRKNYELKKYFESGMGMNLYEAVSEKKELWGR